MCNDCCNLGVKLFNLYSVELWKDNTFIRKISENCNADCCDKLMLDLNNQTINPIAEFIRPSDSTGVYEIKIIYDKPHCVYRNIRFG